MKKLKIILALAFLMTGFIMNAQNLKVNSEKSSVEWTGKKVGGEHNGDIKLKSGELQIKGDQIVSGYFVIDMESMTNADLGSEEYKQKLIGHLKSDDFFGTDTYPTATLKLLKAGKFVDNKASVEGDLTIKGKTNPISFDVKRVGNTYSAFIVVDRSKYDVKYGSKSFFDNLGDKYINDEFTLDVNLVSE